MLLHANHQSIDRPSPLRALAVDDDPATRKLHRRLLTICGAASEMAENGLDALAAVQASLEQKRPFQLILMDLQMPVMDGRTACVRMRHLRFGGKVIAISGSLELCTSALCREWGFDSSISKPANPDHLIAEIRRALFSDERVGKIRISQQPAFQ